MTRTSSFTRLRAILIPAVCLIALFLAPVSVAAANATIGGYNRSYCLDPPSRPRPLSMDVHDSTPQPTTQPTAPHTAAELANAASTQRSSQTFTVNNSSVGMMMGHADIHNPTLHLYLAPLATQANVPHSPPSYTGPNPAATQ